MWRLPAACRGKAAAAPPRTTMRPTPYSMAAVISAIDLLLPCISRASPGTPARTATASSPPLATSMPRPSSNTHRATAGLGPWAAPVALLAFLAGSVVAYLKVLPAIARVLEQNRERLIGM